MILPLLIACDQPAIPTTGDAASFDVYCGDDLEAVMGHVDQTVILNLSMCWEDASLGEVCDMTPAPATIIHRPVWGLVADCTEYGPDAWLRASYLLTR